MHLIDLRSDTVTRPTDAMRAAMASAPVGDDVYGEDPTVRALEERFADLVGKEAALYVTSGTMANQIALGVLAHGGEEVICDDACHSFSFEGGATAALWGIQSRTIRADRGVLAVADVEAAIRPDNLHYARTRAISIENTHNRGGGRAWPIDAVRAVGEVAKRRGLHLYMDGARLMNAVVATGTPARDYAAPTTLVSLALSKGLGAPVGSLLAGPSDLVVECRRLRKRLGGGMRQAGIIAAAGLYALENNVERLAEDHANARRLGALLQEIGVEILHPIETNLVFAIFPGRHVSELVPRLRSEGVLCNAEGSRPDLVRMLTHLDVSGADIDEAVHRIARVVA